MTSCSPDSIASSPSGGATRPSSARSAAGDEVRTARTAPPDGGAPTTCSLRPGSAITVIGSSPGTPTMRDAVTRQEVLVPRGATEPPEEQTFRYRYYGLRLLVQAGDRMFLVPERWDAGNSTLVFDMSDVRIKYRFVNQPP